MSFLPRQDRRYLEERGITVREVVEGAKKSVILTGITLPEGKYQVAQAVNRHAKMTHSGGL